MPEYRPEGVPVTPITTGKLATPELTLATIPIELTVP
jgi:hypothetical protein